MEGRAALNALRVPIPSEADVEDDYQNGFDAAPLGPGTYVRAFAWTASAINAFLVEC